MLVSRFRMVFQKLYRSGPVADPSQRIRARHCGSLKSQMVRLQLRPCIVADFLPGGQR